MSILLLFFIDIYEPQSMVDFVVFLNTHRKVAEVAKY